ncbi:MAG: tartrate dehydrogenase [Planctomycetota bacterium]
MPNHRIAVIAGDGIGPEVLGAAIRVLDSALAKTEEGSVTWHSFDWGSSHYLEHGTMMPADAIDQLRPYDAIYLGAVGHPKVQDHVTLNGLLLPIRRQFDQYVNLRPSYLYEGVSSPLANKRPGSIDLVVFRENTEGEYANVGGRLYQHTSHEVAIQSSIFTRHGTERIIRAAFEHARKRRRHVTSITKSNAQGHSMVFWDEVFAEVARDFPEIQTWSLLVDAAMEMVRRPEIFDVIVASNLFGDILTDLAAIVCGSIGLAASANLNPDKKHPSMFEPVHGSAPDIAGKGIANPLASVIAGILMFEHLGLAQTGRRLDLAVRALLRNQKALPADLGGKATTAETCEALVAMLDSVP